MSSSEALEYLINFFFVRYPSMSCSGKIQINSVMIYMRYAPFNVSIRITQALHQRHPQIYAMESGKFNAHLGYKSGSYI